MDNLLTEAQTQESCPIAATSLSEVRAALETRSDIFPFAHRVGRWVWISFPSRPAPEIRVYLKGLGFHWNRERQAWQHPCGFHSGPAKGYDTRDKYQSDPLQEVSSY